MKLRMRNAIVLLCALNMAIVNCAKDSELPQELSLKVELVSPQNGFVFQNPDSIIFIWKVEDGEVNLFEFEIATAEDTNSSGGFITENIIYSVETEDTHLIWRPTLHASSLLYWHVRPKPSTFPWTEIWHFRVEFPVELPSPIPISPSDGHRFEDEDSIALIWHSVSNASEYQLQISRSPHFTDTLLIQSVTDTQFIWEVVDTGWFWWRVRALTGNISSDWSRARSFEIRFSDFAAIPPLPIFPVDTSLFFVSTVYFIWHSVQGAERYYVEVAEDSNFANVVLSFVEYDTISSGWSNLPRARLWWRVKSIRGSRESRWSAPSQFVISPCIISTITSVRAVASLVDGDILFAIGDDGTFSSFYIADLSAPFQLGDLHFGSCPFSSLVKVGNYIFIPGDICGLEVLDVSNPSAPSHRAIHHTGHGRYIDVESNYGCILTRESGLLIVDITEPFNPVFHGPFIIPRRGRQLILRNSKAYIADLDGGLVIVDVSDWTAPTVISHITFQDSVFTVFLDNDILFVGGNRGILSVWDVSSPDSPSLLAQLQVSSGVISHIAKFGDILLLAVPTEGIWAVDVSTPSAPSVIGLFELEGTPMHIEVVGDSLAFASLGCDGIAIIELR